jgi:hypothetical protein
MPEFMPEVTLEFMREAWETANRGVGNAEPNVPDKEAQQGALILKESSSKESLGSLGSLGWLENTPDEDHRVAQDHLESGKDTSIGIEGVPDENHGVAQDHLESGKDTSIGIEGVPDENHGVAQDHLASGQGASNATEYGRNKFLRDKERPPPLQRARKETFKGDGDVKVHHGVSHFRAASGKREPVLPTDLAEKRTAITAKVLANGNTEVYYDRVADNRTAKQRNKKESSRIYGVVKRNYVLSLKRENKINTSKKGRVHPYKNGELAEKPSLVPWNNIHCVE